METILFSPVGSTDPYRGGYQGPMLHIIYYYKPSKVVLLLTKEMAEKEAHDNRFSLSVKKISELIGYSIDLDLVMSDVQDPSDFDGFITECKDIIHKLHKQNADSQVLLNITSGTPQMNSTLCILASTSSIDLKCIQVKTPEKKSNIKIPFIDSFDINEIENLIDFLPESENRCKEPDILSYRNSFVHEKVKGLIQSFDYTGACNLASIYPGAFSEQAMTLLRHMEKRSKWDITGADKEAANISIPGLQLYAAHNIKAKHVSEYYLCMVLKYKRNDLADMILRISPLLTALCEDFINDKLRFNLDSITERKFNPARITRNKLTTVNESLLDYLDDVYTGGYKDTPVSFNLLLNIIKYQIQINNETSKYSDFIMNLDRLREVESKVRNVTAHQIEYINDEYIRKSTGMSSRNILDTIKLVMKSVYGNNLANDFMDKYDMLNTILIGMIE